jgi:hypothetical protein
MLIIGQTDSFYYVLYCEMKKNLPPELDSIDVTDFQSVVLIMTTK